MTDELRALAPAAFKTFITELVPQITLDKIDRAKLEWATGFAMETLFDDEARLQHAKKALKTKLKLREVGGAFNHALAVYFKQYQTPSGFDFKGLEKNLDAHGKSFLIHLGSHKLSFLRLIIQLARITEEKPKRGLLGVA